MNMNKIFAEIRKTDDEQRMVYGYASTEALDVQGEIVTKEALAGAIDDYMKFANIREMHQPSAVGIAKSAELDDKGLYISVKVVDDSAWAKVKEGVYKGFSIGGRALQKVDGIIKAMRLSEISLVDRPANPEALIEVFKGEGVEGWDDAADAADTAKADGEAATPAVDALAELLNKGSITPERLLEIAQAEVAAAAAPAEAPAAEPTEKADAEPAAVEPAAEPAAEPVAKSFFGEEVWDTQIALEALDRVMSLLWKEQNEDEQMPEQIAALKAAVDALKAFIASEIAEDNGADVELADKDGDIAKAGKMISSKNMEKLQALHDSLVSLGVGCASEKADHDSDMAKMADAISKAEHLEAELKKAADDNQMLKAELEALKAKPMPGKAFLNAVAITKADDGRGGEGPAEQKVETVVDAKGDVNEAASLIKMIHSKGGVIVR